MLKYIFNQQYRKAHNLLAQLGLFSNQYKFRDLGFDQVRKTVEQLERNKPINFFQTCFNIMTEKINKPVIMLKILMFIHFLLQTSNQKSQQMYQLLRKQIIIILRISKNISEQSLQINLPPCLTESICTKQTNQSKFDPNSGAKKFSFYSASTNDVEGTKGPDSSVPIRKGLNIDSAQVSLQKYFCQSFIQPYGVYLLKYESVMKSINQQIVDEFSVIWTEINLLKLLFKISKGLNTFSIYYRGQFMQTITNLIQIISFDIHQFYGSITRKIKQLISIVIQECELRQEVERQKKKFLQDTIFMLSVSDKKNQKRQNQNENHRLKIEEYMKSQISQLQQLLKQLFEINDKILYIYSAKYIRKQLQTIKVKSPSIMRLQNHQYSFVFKKIFQQNKKSNKLKKLQIYRNVKPQLNQFLSLKNNSKQSSGKNTQILRDVKKQLESIKENLCIDQLQQSQFNKSIESRVHDKEERVQTAVDQIQEQNSVKVSTY